MLSGILVAVIYKESQLIGDFIASVLITGIPAVFGYFYFRRYREEHLITRDGFLVVSLSWIIVSAGGALPFYISQMIPSYTDAFFETISGFTTTGASVLANIENLPYSLLFWRSLTHWIGGMGIVVLTVAVLPRLGIGGLKLMKSEVPGPTLDKLTPRINDTARILYLIYLGLTILEVLLLKIGGLNLFDSLTHTFGTLATGGFSPKNSSVGFYNSSYVNIIITIFMLCAGVNFSLFFFIPQRNFSGIFSNIELRTYLIIFGVATLLITISLTGNVYSSLSEGLQHAAFQVASIISTTGFVTADFEKWPNLSKNILFALMFVGGCSGSTAGGIKIIRLITLFKQATSELKYLIHPQGIFLVKIANKVLKKDIIYPVAIFFFIYLFLVLLTTIIVSLSGQDLVTSFTTGLATLGNIGPGLGLIGPTNNYGFYPDWVKWWLSFTMLVGRLEVYSVLVLFSPVFWRR